MGARTQTANLAGMVSGKSEDYWNQQTPSALLGLTPGTGSKAAGASLPPTTAAYGDRQSVPWSLDSPTPWVVGLIVLTLVGMAGADVRFKLFRGRAAASIGNT